VREGGPHFGPALAGLAVAFVFLNREDVEVSDGRRGQRLLDGPGGLLIAIVLARMRSICIRAGIGVRRALANRTSKAISLDGY
jgi:hypothetical protein